MLDKKEIRQEIVNYLCGEEGLKEEFIDLLKSGGLSEDDGYEIKEKLLNEIDSSKDLNLVFYTSFEGKDFPMEEFSKYMDNEEYMELVRMQYPKSIDEAVEMLIEELDKESIVNAKNLGKDDFGTIVHFGLGMYVRNHFGLNNNKAAELEEDIRKNSEDLLLFTDDYSGVLMDHLWERIQRDYDEIIQTKEEWT